MQASVFGDGEIVTIMSHKCCLLMHILVLGKSSPIFTGEGAKNDNFLIRFLTTFSIGSLIIPQ